MKALDRMPRGKNRTSWIAACALMAVVAFASYGQPPANSAPAGGPPGAQRRPRNTDPAKMFDAASKGRDVIYRSSLSDRQRIFFDQIMGGRGGSNAGPNSFISRNDFMNAISSLRQPGNRAGSGANESPRFGTAYSAQSNPSSSSDRSNASGPSTPRRSRASNIDMYMAMSALAAPTPQPDVPRPTMLRADKLQANASAWFTRLDTDHDGQIGLYEWVNAGLSPAEFKMIDRNDDGLITPGHDRAKFDWDGFSRRQSAGSAECRKNQSILLARAVLRTSPSQRRRRHARPPALDEPRQPQLAAALADLAKRTTSCAPTP
jgi:hypothetical protein